jgi:hypothetical protein
MPPSSGSNKPSKIPASKQVDFQWTTWRYISEGRSLHNHRCENLKFYRNFDDSTEVGLEVNREN